MTTTSSSCPPAPTRPSPVPMPPGHEYRPGVPGTSNPADIAAFLRRRSGSRRVVFATYQSSPKIAEAYCLNQVPA